MFPARPRHSKIIYLAVDNSRRPTRGFGSEDRGSRPRCCQLRRASKPHRAADVTAPANLRAAVAPTPSLTRCGAVRHGGCQLAERGNGTSDVQLASAGTTAAARLRPAGQHHGFFATDLIVARSWLRSAGREAELAGERQHRAFWAGDGFRRGGQVRFSAVAKTSPPMPQVRLDSSITTSLPVRSSDVARAVRLNGYNADLDRDRVRELASDRRASVGDVPLPLRSRWYVGRATGRRRAAPRRARRNQHSRAAPRC